MFAGPVELGRSLSIKLTLAQHLLFIGSASNMLIKLKMPIGHSIWLMTYACAKYEVDRSITKSYP